MSKDGTCLALLGMLLLCMVKVNCWPCTKKRLVVSAESIHSQKTSQGHLLSYEDSDPTLIQHPCPSNILDGASPSLYLGKQVFLSLDGFETSLLPLTIPQTLVDAPAIVSSAAFVHKTRLLLVVNQRVFIYFYTTWKVWTESEGVTIPVNKISNAHCCYAPKDRACNSSSPLIVAYDKDSWGNQIEFLLSGDGGYKFYNFLAFTEYQGMLLNIYHFVTLSKIGLLFYKSEDNVTTAYFQYIDTMYMTSEDGIPFVILRHGNETMRSKYVPGLRDFIIFWTKDDMQWSTNHGVTVEDIFPQPSKTYFYPYLPSPDEGIRSVAVTRFEIAILTKDHIFYSSLNMFSKTLVHIGEKSTNTTTDYGEVIMFEYTGMLCIMKPVRSKQTEFYNFQKCVVNVQAALMAVLPPLQPCPVEMLSGNFHDKMYYMDMKKIIYFEVIFVPKPGTGSFPYVTVNNPHILGFKAHLVQDGYTYDGNMKYRLQITLLPQTGRIDYRRGGMSVMTVDVYNKGLFCIDMHPLTALIAVNCPPTKNIKPFKNSTACSKGLFNQYVLQTNFTYTIHADAYDPMYLQRKYLNQSSLNISYSYDEFGCPILLYYDSPWLPTLELWEDDKFVEYVPADFVLYEVNGMHTYDYLLTETEAGCISEAQNWTSLLKIDEDPDYAWTRYNYESCKEATGNYSPASSANKYQILNMNENNRILFQQYNGIYIFKVIVVDPFYSYCELTTVFSVYVHGALPHSEINPSKTLISFLVLIFGSILIVYYFPKLLKENAKMKSVWT